VQDETYGQWIIEGLARQGYRLSSGTLYPMLHGMERKGYLRSREKRTGRSVRRVYRATPKGKRALAVATSRLHELVGGLIARDGKGGDRGTRGARWSGQP